MGVTGSEESEDEVTADSESESASSDGETEAGTSEASTSETGSSETAGTSETGTSETGSSETAGTSETTGTETRGMESETDSTGDGPLRDMGMMIDPNEVIPPPDADGCHAIYAQGHLPEFEIVVQQVVWEQLQYNWDNGEDLDDDPDADPKDYYPLDVFRYQHPGYEQIEIYDAEIRLRGNPINWDPLPDDKMQFQIGFHLNDEENGHFLGIQRLLLDAATYNRTYLRDRLSLAVMRDVDIAAPCANNARLIVDVEYLNPSDEAEFGAPFYYGMFTNLEKIDQSYLDRAWDDPTGDLWKRANWDLKTNVGLSNDDRIDALKDAGSVAELYTYLELEQSLRVFAAEAVLPDSDGMWAGGLNYYFYDDPLAGKFVMLPWDLDNTFDRFDDPPDGLYPINPDPIVWEKQNTWGRPTYEIAMSDPAWVGYYIAQVSDIVEGGYTPSKMHANIDAWDAQIKDSVYDDVYMPWSNSKYDSEIEDLHEYVQQRYEFLDGWIECWENGGTPDAQGYCVPA